MSMRPVVVAGLALMLLAADNPFKLRMRNHWQLASAAQSAVIQGDLSGARTAAQRLAGLDPQSAPPQLEPGLPKLIMASRGIVDAPDLASAAVAVGTLATVCGDCHVATKGGPKLDLESIPIATWSDKAQMPRHQWAMDWMWLGLVSASSEAWSRGARELAENPIPRGEGESVAVDAMEEALRGYATTAAATTDRDARADLYGKMLTTCSQCHVATGASPE